ncbi:MAG: hypothetical protein ACOYU3_01970 [Bacillota bacterium]
MNAALVRTGMAGAAALMGAAAGTGAITAGAATIPIAAGEDKHRYKYELL